MSEHVKAELTMEEAMGMPCSVATWLEGKGFDLSSPITKDKDFYRQVIVYTQKAEGVSKKGGKKK